MTTSWEKSDAWYDQIVGQAGHYYHKHVVIPRVLKLLDLKEPLQNEALLDLGCGQGILARHLPKALPYCGVDLSASLIKKAKEYNLPKNHTFISADVTKSLPLKGRIFSHATFILSLQNMENAAAALQQAASHLSPGGTLVIVLNHPCFRIPRQSHWGIDHDKKLQFRRVDRYLTPLSIPIMMQPGKTQECTLSFHHPLSDYSRFLFEAGCALILLEEWVSDKQSEGKNAKMENRARAEFPLFLALKAIKMFS